MGSGFCAKSSVIIEDKSLVKIQLDQFMSLNVFAESRKYNFMKISMVMES